MTRVHVIGIGAGSPAHLTQQAIAAMREVDVFLVADKGADRRELITIREQICATHLEPGTYKIRALPDPARGPDAERSGAQYRTGVVNWHEARARAWAEEIAALPEGSVVGFLVWGDPAFYDSTLRILDQIRAQTALDVHVVPGISAFQALAAEHQIVLHEIGAPVHITTGRRLVEEWTPDSGTVVVMLDGHLRCRDLAADHPDLLIHWGAYIGMPQQELRSGRLGDVIDEIAELRATLRDHHGWVMDVYALSAPPA